LLFCNVYFVFLLSFATFMRDSVGFSLSAFFIILTPSYYRANLSNFGRYYVLGSPRSRSVEVVVKFSVVSWKFVFISRVVHRACVAWIQSYIIRFCGFSTICLLFIHLRIGFLTTSCCLCCITVTSLIIDVA
jgi:hypothetical protein